MVKISKEEVENIAKLSRISLTEEEKAKYQTELSSILEWVEKLNEVNTNGVQPTGQITGLFNILDSDEVEKCDISREEILKNAPEKKDGFIKVKKVLE
ncbi:MAG: Asp-tRNA(Asn)/Glu-tRNA(Gln) amidotransferase subunit GatC [Patescibacteria group bacterium]|nr:Asp-tRNA(Asn)/Glu-tRNA(Gln) amidotransferase subunit GatC [Patescibacteria group bacterium]